MKKIILFLIIMTFLTNISSAESTNLEEIIDAIKNDELSNDELYDLSHDLQDSDYEQALKLYLTGIIKLREKDHYNSYFAFRSALQLSSNIQSPLLTKEILYHLTKLTFHYGNTTEALKYSQDLLVLAQDNNYEEMIVESEYVLAYTYLLYYDNNAALELSENMYLLSDNINYPKGKYYYYKLLNLMYYYEGEFKEALKQTEKAQSIYDDTWYSPFEFDALTTLYDKIEIYSYLQQHEKIKELLDQIEPSLSSMSRYDQFFYYQALGNYYLDKEMPESTDAINAFETALELMDQASIVPRAYPFQYNVYLTLGQVYSELEQYSQALYYYEQAIYTDFNKTDADIESNLAILEDFKLDDLNKQMSLLEALNQTKTEKYNLAMNFIIGMIISLILLTILIIYTISAYLKKKKVEERLYYHSITDDLTQIYNRRKIMSLFEKNISQECGVILLDIDNFKKINDTYGHVIGDQVLKRIATTIKESIREKDVVGRYGGEEFLVLLSHTNHEDLDLVSERIRKNIEELTWEYPNLTTTVSIGVTPCFSGNTDEVLHAADTLMYEAKNTGKNKVVCHI